MKHEFYPQIFETNLSAKVDEHPSNRIIFVPSGQADGQTDMTKLIVAFRNFANAPKNESLISWSVLGPHIKSGMSYQPHGQAALFRSKRTSVRV